MVIMTSGMGHEIARFDFKLLSRQLERVVD